MMIAILYYTIITMGYLVIAQHFLAPLTWTKPIGNQLSYNLPIMPPNSFDIRRYSDRFDQNVASNFANPHQINLMPAQSVPFLPEIVPGDRFMDGTIERSSGISSSIDIIAPPHQLNRPSTFSPQSRYVGMVSEITNNEIREKSEQRQMQQQQQQQQQQHQPELPPFLVGTSREVQRKFFDIVSNGDETFQQKQDKLDALVSKLDEKKQQIYAEFRREKDAEESEKRSKIHALVATMSQKAQTSFAKVSAVLTNVQLKDAERWQMIQNIYARMDESIKKEFNDRFARLI